MRLMISLFIFFALLVACKNETKTEQQIPFDKMQLVVWQLLKADELYLKRNIADSSWKESKKNVQFYKQIFELNKVDRNQFYKQMENLESHPVELKVLMDSVEALSKREKNNPILSPKKL
jgi:hypothetical protein